MSTHWNEFNLDNSKSSKRQKTSSVTFSELPSSSVISEESTPDILQTSPDKPEQSKTLMVAETSFFITSDFFFTFCQIIYNINRDNCWQMMF